MQDHFPSVLAVEDALLTWIADAKIVLEPDTPPPPVSFPGAPVGGIDGVREVQRTSRHLMWWTRTMHGQGMLLSTVVRDTTKSSVSVRPRPFFSVRTPETILR
jgi:hypothetical protein